MSDATSKSFFDELFDPKHSEVRFVAQKPSTGWPDKFGIVTAWHPIGADSCHSDNADGHARLLAKARKSCLFHFPVTLVSAISDVRTEALGIFSYQPAKLVQWAREFSQPAIFYVEEDELSLISCVNEERYTLGRWQDRLQLLPGEGPGLHVVTAGQFWDKVKAVKLSSITWADEDDEDAPKATENTAKATIIAIPNRESPRQ